MTGFAVSGGAKKELVPVTEQYREQLAGAITAARSALTPAFDSFPGDLCTLVIRLRETAIAKSHRPIDLAIESGLVPAGHGRLDEMLVGSNPTSLDALEWVVRARDTKAIKANLSAILTIEAWTASRRNSGGLNLLRERGSALVRLFKYRSDEATAAAQSSVEKFFKNRGIAFERLPRRNAAQPLLRLRALENLGESEFNDLVQHPSIRTVTAEPIYSTPTNATTTTAEGAAFTLAPPHRGCPIVAVFDTGVSPSATSLAGWVASSESYVIPPDTDFVHGTAVASLVAASGQLNPNHLGFPTVGCVVHNVAGLETSGQSFGVLGQRLRDAVSRRPEVRVWNLSLGADAPCDDQSFSPFGQLLDELGTR